MKTRNLNQHEARTLDSRAIVRVIASALAGLLWGVGWGLCVETSQRNAGLSFLGYDFTSLQAFGLGISGAGGAVVTLAFIFHPRRPFWRLVLLALLAAFLSAVVFYAVLAALTTLLHLTSSTLESFLLPLGWSIDNAVLFFALQNADALHSSKLASEPRGERTHVAQMLFGLLVLGLWLFCYVARSIVSNGVMFALIPPIVWTALAMIAEVERNTL